MESFLLLSEQEMALRPIQIGLQYLLLLLSVFRFLLISQFLTETENIAEIDISFAVLLQTAVDESSQVEVFDDVVV